MKVLGALLLGCLVFVAFMLFLGALPKIIALLSDPPRIKRIRQFFEAAGCTEIEIKPWPNHYGVRYIKDGLKQYAKCRVNMKAGTIEWIGGAPSWGTPPNNSFKPKPLRGSA
jgi:hypothetical protein